MQLYSLRKEEAYEKYMVYYSCLPDDIAVRLWKQGARNNEKSKNGVLYKNLKDFVQSNNENIDFEIWEKCDDHYVIRFVTSWHTTEDEVDALFTYLEQASEKKE